MPSLLEHYGAYADSRLADCDSQRPLPAAIQDTRSWLPRFSAGSPSVKLMARVERDYTGDDCPYCGEPLYVEVTTWPLGGHHKKVSRTEPRCDTATCADKRTREAQR